jgi:hypothetical protein
LFCSQRLNKTQACASKVSDVTGATCDPLGSNRYRERSASADVGSPGRVTSHAANEPKLLAGLGQHRFGRGLAPTAFETRQADLAALREQLEMAREVLSADPVLGRKLANIEDHFGGLAATIGRLERQMEAEAKVRAGLSEIVNLINVKLTRLAHDLLLRSCRPCRPRGGPWDEIFG